MSFDKRRNRGERTMIRVRDDDMSIGNVVEIKKEYSCLIRCYCSRMLMTS